MREASNQNELFLSIIDQQIKLEQQSANSLGDIAVAAAGIAPSDTHNSREQEIARIAATAAGSSGAELAPGRILSQLGAELGVEALRRLRTATLCHKVLVEERISPMVLEFTQNLALEANKGASLLSAGREVNAYVRDAFEEYDAAARRAQKSFSAESLTVVEMEHDVWLLHLR
jgi:hypothetical protein